MTLEVEAEENAAEDEWGESNEFGETAEWDDEEWGEGDGSPSKRKPKKKNVLGEVIFLHVKFFSFWI